MVGEGVAVAMVEEEEATGVTGAVEVQQNDCHDKSSMSFAEKFI